MLSKVKSNKVENTFKAIYLHCMYYSAQLVVCFVLIAGILKGMKESINVKYNHIKRGSYVQSSNIFSPVISGLLKLISMCLANCVRHAL
jgi:hypothetical protein